jgi:hypothetical protein
MTDQLGDAKIQQQYRDDMNNIANALDTIFNGDARGEARKTGFVLLVFPFGDAKGARCNFISNGADRKDIVALFKEMVARFTGGVPKERGRDND